MSSEFFIKRTNQLPVLRAELADSQGPVSLISASGVDFIYRKRPTSGSITGTVHINTGQIISGAEGIVQYNWTTGDVNTAGHYLAEWRVTFTNGQKLSFPNSEYLRFQIVDDLPD
jgi:hypothetical protein